MDAVSPVSPTSYSALLRDVAVVKKYVTGRPDEEILAYLEAHYRDPNRVEKVIKELSRNEYFARVSEKTRENAVQEQQLLGNVGGIKGWAKSGLNKRCWEQTATCRSQRNASQQLVTAFNSIQPVRLNVNDKLLYNKQLKILTGIYAYDDPNYLLQTIFGNEKKRENALPQLDLNDDEAQQLLGINKCCWHQTCTCWSRRNAAQQVDAGFYSIQPAPAPAPIRLNEKEKSFYDEQLKILGNVGNIDFINDTVNSWLQKGNYKKKWMEVEENGRSDMKRKIFEMDCNVEDFLKMFPDPESHFNRYHSVSRNYLRHIRTFVCNTFDMDDRFLLEVFNRLKFQFIPIMRELDSCWSDPSTVLFREKQEMPEIKDELFYQELTYLKLYKQIKAHEERKKDERVKKLEKEKLSGPLTTCECCFEEEVCLEDMLACPKNHKFCKDCIRKQAQVNLGLNKFKFPCFNGYCKEQFSMKVLQECLPPKTYSTIVKKGQEEMCKAGIPEYLKESCSSNLSELHVEDLAKGAEIARSGYFQMHSTEHIPPTRPKLPEFRTVFPQNDELRRIAFRHAALKRKWPEQEFSPTNNIHNKLLTQRINQRLDLPFSAPPSYTPTNSNSNRFFTNSIVTSSSQINRNPPPPPYPVLRINSSNSRVNSVLGAQNVQNFHFVQPFPVASTSTSAQSNYPPYWETSPALNVLENSTQHQQMRNIDTVQPFSILIPQNAHFPSR